MIKNVDDYFKSPILKFPIKSDIGLTIPQLHVKCYKCRGKNVSIRANIYERKRCIELIGGSACPKCKMITPFKYRLYTDRRQMLNITGRWITVNPIKKPLRIRILDFLKKIFYII